MSFSILLLKILRQGLTMAFVTVQQALPSMKVLQFIIVSCVKHLLWFKKAVFSMIQFELTS